jgi:erythromycin esterase-like protein
MPLEILREAAHPLTGGASDYDPLIDLIGDARFVLIGEASHGTADFYRERAAITWRLIVEKGFSAVAAEADWPDARRVDRHLRGLGSDGSAVEALAGFQRFPAWMWRNDEVARFITALRARNDSRPPAARAGFYGLDLYSLRASMEAVLEFLERVDPAAARRARERYGCFDHVVGDPQNYGLAAGLGLTSSCQDAVVAQLLDLQRRAGDYTRRDGAEERDEIFSAQQNARLVMHAEAYYRSMFLAEESSWNLRDRHMADILEALADHLGGAKARIVVWAHNSHLGDARATEMANRGELNLGQLVRQRHGRHTVSIGFTTYAGTVTAAESWDAPAERKRLRPALDGSHEDLFHRTGVGRFLLLCHGNHAVAEALHEPRLERAVGVIYRPDSERRSHYFHADLARQFDAVIHLDETSAVTPLERTARWDHGEVPETFPSGI